MVTKQDLKTLTSIINVRKNYTRTSGSSRVGGSLTSQIVSYMNKDEQSKMAEYFTNISGVIAEQDDYDAFIENIKNLKNNEKVNVANSIADLDNMSIPTSDEPRVVVPGPGPGPTQQPTQQPTPQQTASTSTQIRKTKFNKKEITAYAKILKAVSGLVDIDETLVYMQYMYNKKDDENYQNNVDKIYTVFRNLIENGVFKEAERILENHHGVNSNYRSSNYSPEVNLSIKYIHDTLNTFKQYRYKGFNNRVYPIDSINSVFKSLNKVVKNVENWMNKLDLCKQTQ